MNLYQLNDNLYSIQAMLEAWDGQDTEELKALQDTEESLRLALEDKIDGYCKLIRNLEADNNGLKDEIERMSAAVKRNNNKIEWLKNTLTNVLNANNTKSAKGALFSVRLQSGPGKLELKVPESELPEEYIKTTQSVNKAALKEDLKSSDLTENDYCQIVKSESLRIKNG